MKIICTSFAIIVAVMGASHASSPYEGESVFMDSYSLNSVVPYKKEETVAHIQRAPSLRVEALTLCRKDIATTMADKTLTEAYLQLFYLENGYYPGSLSSAFVSPETKDLKEPHLLEYIFSRLGSDKGDE